MLTSHAFKPKTSACSRNAAVDSAFVCPSYRGRVAFDHGVLHVAGSYIVEFDVPAYPGLYPSFLVFFPILRPKGLRAFYKQLAATTNYIWSFTSSFGYFITGYLGQVT